MKPRYVLALGFIALAAAATWWLVQATEEEEDEQEFDVPWTGSGDEEDPFALMIEEGAGLIGQLMAEAAARASR